MFILAVSDYVLSCCHGLPELYGDYWQHARLLEEIDLGDPEEGVCFLGVESAGEVPLLAVALRYDCDDSGFFPGAVLIPETRRLFVGAGERILGYDLERVERLWQERTDVGFWGWQRHGEVVVMSAERELAAWDLAGTKLWSAAVEPPWSYSVDGPTLALDVLGRRRSRFDLASGP